MNRELIFWLGLGVLILLAFSFGARRGVGQGQSAIQLQEATTPLQPATQPALLASAVAGLSPSGSSHPSGVGVGYVGGML